MTTRGRLGPGGFRTERSMMSTMEVVDDTTIKSGELAMEQVEQRGDTLAEAKDKAQLVATTAMSIVHITLLKEVLDRGPVIPYYYVSLSLISTALALQVIIGLIAIVVANLRKYYARHRESACADVAENICCCKLKSRSRIDREERLWRMVHEQAGDLDLGRWDVMSERAPSEKQLEAEDGDTERGCCYGLPCTCTSHIYPAYEYDILDRYDLWSEKSVITKLNAVRPRQELGRVRSFIEGAKSRIQLLEAQSKGNESEDKELESKLKMMMEEMAEAQEKAMKMERTLIEENILAKQGEILSKYSDAIRKNRVLKLVSFWQNAINYMLYVVFILNAFIAGFGLGGRGAPPMAEGGSGDEGGAVLVDSLDQF